MELKIEKGVPLPGAKGAPAFNVTQTLRNMEVGDSFLLSVAKRPSIYQQARLAGIKIAARTTGDGEMRVWRVA